MALLEQKQRSYTSPEHNNSGYSRDTELNIVLLCCESRYEPLRVNIRVAFELRFHRVQVLLRFTTQVSKVRSRLRFTRTVWLDTGSGLQ